MPFVYFAVASARFAIQKVETNPRISLNPPTFLPEAGPEVDLQSQTIPVALLPRFILKKPRSSWEGEEERAK